MKEQRLTSFSHKLLQWHNEMDRDLPWKSSDDPYIIYVSEIILQQTRVEQGTPYFLKFIDRFPRVESLAKAEEDEVFAIWQGLGYYSRARNMMKTAKIIWEENKGRFPADYEKLLKLPGIGPYTASAIASFAFKLPHAVVDGNVIRVVSRLQSIAEQVEKEGKKIVTNWVNKEIKDAPPDLFNQAIMDLGALVCKPRQPLCEACPFEGECSAHATQNEHSFPVKKQKAQKRSRYFHFFLIRQNNMVLIKKREDKDIWKGLYQLPSIETKAKEIDPGDLSRTIAKKLPNLSMTKFVKTADYKQELSHQRIYAQFYENEGENTVQDILPPYYLVERKNLNNYAFPKVLDWYLEQKSIYLIN
jgi:A/G-specific adenine glycosylase